MDLLEEMGVLLLLLCARSLSQRINGKAVYPKRTDGLFDADIMAHPESGIRNNAA
jgi:hypothetical protein